MKTTTKRFLSVLLSVFMIFGTVALMIPAAVITATAYESEYTTITVNSAEQSFPYSMTHNADNVIGGLAFHFDQKGHGDCYAQINEDCTVTLKVKRGDMFWMPDVEIDEQSTIHVEAVMVATPTPGNTIIGPVFDITTSTGVWQTADDSCTGGMLYGGAPGFGIGRYQFQYTNTNGSLQDGSYWPNRWQSYSSAISVFSVGQQINYDISKTGDDVTFTFTDAASSTVITSQTYDDSTRNTYQGAAGFLCCWETGGSNSVTYTIKNYQITNALVKGERQNFDLVAFLQSQRGGRQDYEILTHNTNHIYNGVNLHFDEKSHGNSVAKINGNGTVTLKVGRGDMFWMPNVEIDETSTIHVEVVMDSTPNAGNTIIGPVFDITTSTGVWQTADDSCTGGMLYGGAPGFGIGRYQFQYTNTNGSLQDGSYWPNRWQSYSSAISVFSVGQQINYDISKTGDNVTITFTDAASSTVITSQTYDDSTRDTYKGAVGFLTCWEAGGNPIFTIKNYQVTNALVNGVRQNFDLVAMLSAYMTENNYVLRSSLSLNGTIGLNIRVDANAYIAGSEKLVVTDSASNVIVDQALSGLWSAANGYYVGSIPVNAKEMTDVFTVCLKNGDDVIAGTTISNVSVKSYAEALAASDPSWADLMDAMLKYGAAAQQLFDYNTGNLAADISGGITYDASSDPSLSADMAYNAFISRVAGTLTLESGTDLNLYVLPVDGEATFTASAMSNSVSVPVTVAENGDYWQITISDLKAEELGDPFYITVSDGTHSVTFTYSALCWVKAAINDANASANTKTLAKAIGVYASEAQKKNNKSVVSLAGQIAGAGTVSALRSATDSRVSSIRSSANDASIVWTSGSVKNYYVSSSTGSDSNSGTDENHPWKTLAKVNAVLNEGSSSYKYNVYLKRGDTWRGEYLKTYKTSNVTITAYGSGAKPIIMGSPENGANASKWTDMGNNIWRYEGSNGWDDVGNIVFNNGESYGCKVVQLYVKHEGKSYRITNFSHPTDCQKDWFESYTDLKNDLDFYHDKDFDGGSGATGYLYLYSTSNPGSRFSSIEFSVKQHGIEIYKANNVRVDNVCVKYVGGHGIAGNGLNLQNILIQNCEFDWIGGSIHDRIKASIIGTDTTAYDTRYGNAVEIYGGCDNFRVQNNYIYQCYDTGITQQYSCGGNTDSDHTANQLNIYYHNNVIENCNYSIEYFISNCPTGNSSYINNFQITDNIMWNAGKGFCETRGQWNLGFAAHIKAQSGSTSCNRFANSENAFVISGNKFIGQRDAVFAICSKMDSSNANANPVVTNNEIYGVYNVNKIGAVCNYNSGSDVSIHNVYAPFDTDIQTYMNGQIGASKFSGNTIKFLV